VEKGAAPVPATRGGDGGGVAGRGWPAPPPHGPDGADHGGELGATTVALQPSGPEPFIGEERALTKRRILVPVVTRHEAEAAGPNGFPQPEPPSPSGQTVALEAGNRERGGGYGRAPNGCRRGDSPRGRASRGSLQRGRKAATCRRRRRRCPQQKS